MGVNIPFTTKSRDAVYSLSQIKLDLHIKIRRELQRVVEPQLV